MRRLRPAAAVALGLASLLAVVPARAGNEGAAAAGALFQQGRADAARGDYEHACRRFAESQRLVPAAGTVINLADCEEHRGHLADALEQFRRGLESLPPSDDRVAFVRGRIARLSPRVPRVLFRATGAVSVTLDDVTLGDAALGVPLPVNPGARRAVVRAPGRQDRAYAFTVAEGQSTALDIAPGPLLLPAPTRPPALAAVAPRQAAGSSHRLAWTGVGVGAAGFVTATVAGVLALGSESAVNRECPAHRCPSQAGVDRASAGQTEATVSTVGLGVGVVGAAIATYAFLRDAHESAPGAASATSFVTPLLGPSAAGLSFGGTFP